MYSLALSAPMFLASCSSDDNNEEPVTEVTPILTSATVDYKYYVSEDLLQIADVQIAYLDNNVTRNETLTTTSWEKTGHLNTFPGQLGFTVLITPKADFLSLLKDSDYYFYYGNTKTASGQEVEPPFIKLTDQNGKAFSNESQTLLITGMETTLVPGKVYEYLDVMPKPAYGNLIRISQDGTITSQTTN